MIQTISYPIADVVPYINWLYFFHAWQLPTGYASLKHLHRCPSCRAHWVTQYPEAERDKAREGIRLYDEACDMLDGIVNLGAKAAVITSACIDGQRCVIGRRSDLPLEGFRQRGKDGPYFRIDYDEIPVAFHGTGDIFSAVLIGHLMNGETLKESTRTAMAVVSSLIERNREQKDLCLGIPIEKCLDLL